MKYAAPDAPYVEALHQGGKQKPTAIVLGPSFTHSRDGAALGVAQGWHKSGSFWDAGHYTVDEHKRFRCVRDNVIAGEDQDYRNAIRIAVCAEPVSGVTFWDGEVHGEVLRQAAKLVAELTLVYKIKPVGLNDADLERWKKCRSRRRGGIHMSEVRGFPLELFFDEVYAQRNHMIHN